MKKNTKISFFSPWWSSCDAAKEDFSRMTPGKSGKWKNVEAVSDPNNADYFVILRHETEATKRLSDSKKIYLQREPDVIESEKAFQNNNGAYIASYDNEYHFSTWHVDKTYDQLKNLSYPEKSKVLNSVLSYKYTTYGHRQRSDFIAKYLSEYPEGIDVYGTFNNVYPYLKKGVRSKLWHFFNRFLIRTLKQKKIDFDKFEKTILYKYSFVAENCQQKNYFTEKIVDAYLSWSMPIYWGCPNINDYFPEDSYHWIDITADDAVKRMYEITQKPIMEKNIKAISEARGLILDKYNIWPSLVNIINNKI